MDLKKQPTTGNNNHNQKEEGRGPISTITPFAMETAERYLAKKKDAVHKEYLLKFSCGLLGLFASICFLFVILLSYRNVQLESENLQLIGNLRQLSMLLNAAMVQSQIDQGTILFNQKQQEILQQIEKMERWLASPENLLPLELQNDDWLTVPEQSEDEYESVMKDIFPGPLIEPARDINDEIAEGSDPDKIQLSGFFSPYSFFPVSGNIESPDSDIQADDDSSNENSEDEQSNDEGQDLENLFGMFDDDNDNKLVTPSASAEEDGIDETEEDISEQDDSVTESPSVLNDDDNDEVSYIFGDGKNTSDEDKDDTIKYIWDFNRNSDNRRGAFL